MNRRSARRALGGKLLLGRDLVADLLQRAPDQPRHVHLRDADLLRNLRLRQPLEEAQVEDLALALVEHAEAGREHGAVLRDLVLMLVAADRLERVELLAVLLGAPARERERRVGTARLERLEHLLLPDARGLRQLGDRRRAAELHGQLLDQPRELHVQLLQPARHAHRPALVAEVPLDLADDVRRRIRRQLDAAAQVEAVNRLDQADRADLDEILELLAAVRVPARKRAHERHVLLDQLLAGGDVALLVVAAQKLAVVARHQMPPSTVFLSSTHWAPSRSLTSTPSTTVSRTRRRPRPVSAACSSSATRPLKGPTVATIAASSIVTVSVTSSADSRRFSSSSIAVVMSSSTS